MADIQPYRVDVPQADIRRLNQKLLDVRLPDEGEAVNSWERGTPVQEVRRISKYWRETFSWKAFEERLNQLPHYEATMSLEGFQPFQVHFVHQRSKAPDAIPLLFVHGWPGHFYEVHKLIPLLAESEKSGGPAFHVVAPSLPNFGFSSGIDKPGFGMKQYAETCHQLMLGLGYEQYASQGGDWGSSITRMIAAHYPQSLRATHLNLVVAMPPSPASPVAFIRFLVTHLLKMYTPQETAGLKANQNYQEDGNGYFQVQKTRPNTIGISLADSPAGLLAWIYEKLVTWTDTYPWTDEEVCEWVSLYWFSRAGPAASVTIYHEAFRGEWVTKAGLVTPGTKMGFSYFPKELFGTPRFWNRRLGDVVFEHEHERGGHFAAWEQPEALVGDLRIMFGRGGGAFGVMQPTAINK